MHELWKRDADPRVRHQVILFNVAATVTIGILTLYAAFFAVIFAGVPRS